MVLDSSGTAVPSGNGLCSLWLSLVSAGWSEVKYMKCKKLRDLIYGGCEQQENFGASGGGAGRSAARCPSPAGRELHGWQNGEKA